MAAEARKHFSGVQPWRISKPLVRSEEAQAQYLTELLTLFEEEKLEGALAVADNFGSGKQTKVQGEIQT